MMTRDSSTGGAQHWHGPPVIFTDAQTVPDKRVADRHTLTGMMWSLWCDFALPCIMLSLIVIRFGEAEIGRFLVGGPIFLLVQLLLPGQRPLLPLPIKLAEVMTADSQTNSLVNYTSG